MHYPMAYAAGSGMPVQIRKVENGFIVDMEVEVEEGLMDSMEGQAAEAILGRLPALMGNEGDDWKAEAAQGILSNLPPRKVKKPVTVVCLTLEEVLERIKEHFA